MNKYEYSIGFAIMMIIIIINGSRHSKKKKTKTKFDHLFINVCVLISQKENEINDDERL